MPIDVLILNSGEWYLAEELPATPWHILIYRQRPEPRNELHLWLPRRGMRGNDEFAFRRYWMDGGLRWCVEIPRDPDRMRMSAPPPKGKLRVRFSAPDGSVIWSTSSGSCRLGDFTDPELERLRATGEAAPFSRIWVR